MCCKGDCRLDVILRSTLIVVVTRQPAHRYEQRIVAPAPFLWKRQQCKAVC